MVSITKKSSNFTKSLDIDWKKQLESLEDLEGVIGYIVFNKEGELTPKPRISYLMHHRYPDEDARDYLIRACR